MLHGPGKFAINGLDSDLHNEYQDVEAQSEFGAVFDYVPTVGLLISSPVLEKTTKAKVKRGFSWRDQQELKLGPIPVSTWIDAGGLVINQPMMLDMNCFFTPEEYSLGLAVDTEPVLVSIEANLQKWSKYQVSYTDSVNNYPDPDFNDTPSL